MWIQDSSGRARDVRLPENELRIGIVRDLVAINPEWCQVNEALWLFVGKPITSCRISHQEFSGRNQRHIDRERGAKR